ncbi:MAG: hypothetical protein ACRC2A_17185 [Enterobacterales bacterium]|uniref:hypothetical protein n=1 Tax=Serratia sp. (in: enterobacteria) TaxID=616 RepID=UPI003F35DFE5
MQGVKFRAVRKIIDGGGWSFSGRNLARKWVIITRHTGSVSKNYPHIGGPVAEETHGI